MDSFTVALYLSNTYGAPPTVKWYLKHSKSVPLRYYSIIFNEFGVARHSLIKSSRYLYYGAYNLDDLFLGSIDESRSFYYDISNLKELNTFLFIGDSSN